MVGGLSWPHRFGDHYPILGSSTRPAAAGNYLRFQKAIGGPASINVITRQAYIVIQRVGTMAATRAD
jgi:hypothetical protein